MKTMINESNQTNGTNGNADADPVVRFQVEWRALDAAGWQAGWHSVRPVVAHRTQALGLLAAQVMMDGPAAGREYRVLEHQVRVVFEKAEGTTPRLTEMLPPPPPPEWRPPAKCKIQKAKRKTSGTPNGVPHLVRERVGVRGPVSGKESVQAVVERVLPTLTQASFTVPALLGWVQHAGRPQAQKSAVQKALETCVEKGTAMRVKRGEYMTCDQKAAEPRRSVRGIPQPDRASRKPRDPALPDRYNDPAVRLGRLRIAAMEALALDAFAGRQWTREALLQAIKKEDPELVDALETGELGSVVRAFQAEGRVRLVAEPTPQSVAVYETM